MPRPKKTTEYQEGPQAAENFTRLMQRLVRPPRAVLETETRQIDEITTVEVVTRMRKKPSAK